MVTNAYFSDTETSTGNTFQAGEIDLKIDHTRQVYNNVDCQTCSVILISDTTNMIVAKDNVAVDPFPAVLAWIHPVWTAQNDPTLDAANAEWIWATNPTTQEDVENNVIYTFRKEFTWLGPATSSDLWFAVGSDNSVEVWLNGTKIGENLGEFGYLQGSMLQIPSATVTSKINQGNNILEFKVQNFARIGETPEENPGGLIYKFEINGRCTDNFFKSNCRLWAEKDLETGDVFWQFDDLKPGDRGLNVISYRVYDNDAWMCANLDITDLENVMVEPESPPDVAGPDGELSKYIEAFVWKDLDGDGNYDSGETEIASGTLDTLSSLPIAEPTGTPVPASTTNYIGFAWCFGDLTAVADSPFTCSGLGDQNDAQTDIVNATVNFYAEQFRNNPDFRCQSLITPTTTTVPTNGTNGAE